MGLAVLTALLLVVTGAVTERLIPLFALGIFIGFSVSQLGMVRYWYLARPARWRRLAVLNGTGAALTLVATAVLLVLKFTRGAWAVVLVVPLLMLLFARVERYYGAAAGAVGAGRVPPRPVPGRGLVVVPVGELSAVTAHVLARALTLGGDVVAVTVDVPGTAAPALARQWREWDPGVPLETLPGTHHALLEPIVRYVQRATAEGRDVTVLVPRKLTRRHRERLLQGGRPAVLAALLRRRTDAVVSTVPYHLDTAARPRAARPEPPVGTTTP
nr:hypothetical protein [Kitasatospora sp. SID7827]